MRRGAPPLGRMAGAVLLALAAAPADAAEPHRLAFGVGQFDPFQPDTDLSLSLEWRGPETLWIIRPYAGLGVSGDAARYFYGGIMLDIPLGDRLVVTPSFAPVAYFKGDGKDLGYTLEFRSGVEIAWRFDDRSRLGVALHHLSNASLGTDNPGAETLNLYYAAPLDRVFERFR